MSKSKIFSSDNICKVSPHILQDINLYDDLNDINISGYIESFFHKLFGSYFHVNYINSVTSGNIIALKNNNISEIICSKNSHIYKYEKREFDNVYPLKYELLDEINGKINIDKLAYLAHKINLSSHVLVITIPTEYGIIYTDEEVLLLLEIAINSNIKIHIDGARLFYYTNSFSEAYKKLFDYAESITISFTKFGTLFGEVLLLKENNNIKNLQIECLQKISKSNYIPKQIYTFLENDCHIIYPLQSIKLTQYFKSKILEKIQGNSLILPVEANILYVKLSKPSIKNLSERYSLSLSSNYKNTIRIVCNYSNTIEEINEFCKYILA